MSGGAFNDIWAVAWLFIPLVDYTQLLYYNGVSWNVFPIGTERENVLMLDVFVRAPDDVWFVGFNGNVWHFDGTELVTDSTVPVLATLQAVWGPR